MSAQLRIERPADGVALVVLDRPAQLNALDDDLLLRLVPDTFAQLSADSGVRAIVVTGAGRGFCAGADLSCSGFGQPTTLDSEQFIRATHRGPVAVRSCRAPTIAAVNGPAVGAGFGLALACDLRLTAPTGRFGAPFVGMGLVPDYGVSYFLPRLIGVPAALELLLAGRLLEASEAVAAGLAARIEEDVVGSAIDLAATIAMAPPHAVAATKANLYGSMELDLEAEVLEQEVRAQAIALHGPEFTERIADYRRRIRG